MKQLINVNEYYLAFFKIFITEHIFVAVGGHAALFKTKQAFSPE